MMKRPSPTKRAEKYIAQVLLGELTVSDQVLLTCKRHQKDLVDGHDRGLVFDPAQGSRVIEFVEAFCHHSQGEWAGHPVTLEPWQCAMLYILYGWRWSSSSYRRFRFAYIELAKGNGKSFLASALAIYELIGSGEPGAEVYSTAVTRDQAKVVFDEAVLMVAKSPSLKKRIKSFRNNLHVPGTASKFQPLSSEAGSLEGKRPQCIVADELHRWGVNGRDLWDTLSNALGKRRSPLFLVITTSGSGRESLCFQQHEYSEKVNSGIVPDDTWFSWVCCLSEGEDFEDPNVWIKSNPNLGVSVKHDELAAAINKSKQDPASLNGTLRLRLGVWTENISTWMEMEAWDKCKAPISREALKGRPCFGGLDLSTTTDISALVLVFPPYGDDKLWSLLPFFWLPKDNITKRCTRDRVPYDVWERQGLFELTDGNVIDYDFIRQRVIELADEFDIKEIAFDRYNSSQLVTQLLGDGLEMVKHGQGFESMNSPTKRLMELVLRGEVAHGCNPVLRWMMSNTVVRIDPTGSIKPDKEKSREKIDGVVSAVMGIGRASLVPLEPTKSSFKPFFL